MKVAIFLLCLIPLVLGEKRFLIDINRDPVPYPTDLQLVKSLITSIESDPSGQQCEAKCLQLFENDIPDLGCGFACKGIQSLIQRFPHQTITNSATAST